MKTKPKSLGQIAYEEFVILGTWIALAEVNKKRWHKIALAVKRAVIRDLRQKGKLK